MKIRYRTMTLLVSILASVALVGDRVRRRARDRRILQLIALLLEHRCNAPERLLL